MGTLVVIEKNRVAGQRIARVVSAAAGMAAVVVAESLEEARGQLPSPPVLLCCDAALLDEARAWFDTWPALRAVTWTAEDVPRVVAAVRDERRVRNVLGWPSFASMPRPWELLLAARRLVDPLASVPKLQDLLLHGGHAQRWRPRTTAELAGVVEESAAVVARCGVGSRTADRVSEVVHELLMNAMYDAPVDGWGQARYAADRRQALTLDDAEVPTLRLAFDGVLIALEVADPFGRLRDEHVIDGIVRGAANASSSAPALDTSHGGAGLGMARVHASSTAMVVDVRPLESTRVLWFFELDLSARDTRGMPSSLHLFRSDPPGGTWP
jgi:hypothetical protein